MSTDWDRIEDDWHAYQELAKEQWPRVEASTLAATQGRRDALIAAVEQAYDVSRDQARREVGYWMGAAPRLRKERADVRQVPTGNRWSGQQRPKVDSYGQGEQAGRFSAMRTGPVREHPVGALLLALGVGFAIVRMARAGRD